LTPAVGRHAIQTRKDDTMQMVIDFPGGARVDAHFGPHTVLTDQPPQGGGEGSAPTPFAMFLASIGTCAGIYVLGFCRQRGIPTEGLRLLQDLETDPASGMVSRVMLDIEVPADFPEKYKASLVRAAEQCAVKKHLEHPPTFEVRTSVPRPVPA
jgi:ribosomal protein S12 methylthiotransferase accessory factor